MRRRLSSRVDPGNNPAMVVLADLFSDPLPAWVVIVLALPGLSMLIGVVVYLGYTRLTGGGRK